MRRHQMINQFKHQKRGRPANESRLQQPCQRFRLGVSETVIMVRRSECVAHGYKIDAGGENIRGQIGERG